MMNRLRVLTAAVLFAAPAGLVLAQTKAAPAGVTQVSAGVMKSRLLTKVDPVYPADAVAAQVDGRVDLRVAVDKTGKVTKATAISGPEALRSAAETAVSQWVYQTYLVGGRPVAVSTHVLVDFALPPLVTAAGINRALTLNAESLQKEATGGSFAAQWVLAWRCHSGTGGIKADAAEATTLDQANFARLQPAVDRGQAYALFLRGLEHSFGLVVPVDYAQAVAYFTKAANAGDFDAKRELGFDYLNGRGVAKDVNRGIALYKEAAEVGDLQAQRSLGQWYRDGTQVTQDYTESIAWFRKAAAQGAADAMDWLGYFYREGKGVAVNPAEAANWFIAAAAKGYAQSQANLADLYLVGSGVEKSDPLAFYWFGKAANQGNVHSMEWLGSFYRDGRGVAVDFRQARFWFKKAADAGSKNAPNLLANVDQIVANRNAQIAANQEAARQRELARQQALAQQQALAEQQQEQQNAQMPADDSGDGQQQQPSQSIFGQIVQAVGDAEANAPQGNIQTTLQQQLANIQAAQAQAQQQQQRQNQQQNNQNNSSGDGGNCHITAAQRAANPKVTCRGT